MAAGLAPWVLCVAVIVPAAGFSAPPLAAPQSGVVYYVATNGHDDNSGVAPAEAWRTLAKVSSTSFSPGDAVLLRRGDEWYEALTISSSGTADQPILFGTYGTGPRPRILGSVALTEWTLVAGNIWVSATTLSDPSRGAPHDGSQSGSGGYPGGAWFVELDGSVTWGHQEKEIGFAGDFAELTGEYDWGWYADHLYLYSTVDPGMAYQAVHASQRQYAVGMPGNDPQDHVVIEGLEMMFTQSKGFYGGYPAQAARGLTIRDCHIAYVGVKGAASAYGLAVWHSGMLIQDNEIHDCGRRSVSYNVYATRGVVFEDVVIEGNHFHHGYHTTGLDIASSGSDTMRGFVVRGNLFEGDPAVDLGGPEGFNSNHVWTQTHPDGRLEDFEFSNNIFTYCHGKGLTINRMDDVLMAFNTFYGVNPTLANYQAQLYFSNEVSNVVVRNNIFVNDVNPGFNPYFFSVKADSANLPDVDMDRNLFFTTDSDAAMVDVVGITGSYSMDEWSTYQAETGWDGSSPGPQSPQMVAPGAGDFHLAAGSPAIGAGEDVPGIVTDFEGLPRTSPPSLGALSYRPGDLIFGDGFETGDPSRWSASSP